MRLAYCLIPSRLRLSGRTHICADDFLYNNYYYCKLFSNLADGIFLSRQDSKYLLDFSATCVSSFESISPYNHIECIRICVKYNVYINVELDIFVILLFFCTGPAKKL